ncbi:AMP-binding protein [Rhodococcus hoagii]|nr:AMP-binding protein [Prescottella equi]
MLQFYCSNETARSVTNRRRRRRHPPAHVRARGGRGSVRVFDDARYEVARCRGAAASPRQRPLTCHRYWDDDAANAELYTDDGWMLLGDIVEIDAAGRLRVVGRKADIIIRCGKNISAVESRSSSAPIRRSDGGGGRCARRPVRREVCAVVVTADGTELTADDLSRGWPRRRHPRVHARARRHGGRAPLGARGKVAKGVVKVLAEQQLSR